MESALRDRADTPGLMLIETLGWDGRALVRLPLHLARLAASAARLGWPCDTAAAVMALHSATTATPARLRLTLDATGQCAATAAAMPAPLTQWRLGRAATRLTAADPWLTVKSTHRPAYDAARAALPAKLDEVILVNDRDEVCDGTITTLFFDTGTGLCTPPLSCGLLPGVLRADLIAQGCRERILPAADLPQAKLFLGNSLRGLSPAIWQP